jgi:hypothetical protein
MNACFANGVKRLGTISAGTTTSTINIRALKSDGTLCYTEIDPTGSKAFRY